MWKKNKGNRNGKLAKLIVGGFILLILRGGIVAAGYIRLRKTPILLPAELREYLYC